MSQNCCCVQDCFTFRRSHDGLKFLSLHFFPHPEKDSKRFDQWKTIIGGELHKLDPKYIFYNRRVCHKHFENKYVLPFLNCTRLLKTAIPTLHIPGYTGTPENEDSIEKDNNCNDDGNGDGDDNQHIVIVKNKPSVSKPQETVTQIIEYTSPPENEVSIEKDNNCNDDGDHHIVMVDNNMPSVPRPQETITQIIEYTSVPENEDSIEMDNDCNDDGDDDYDDDDHHIVIVDNDMPSLPKLQETITQFMDTKKMTEQKITTIEEVKTCNNNTHVTNKQIIVQKPYRGHTPEQRKYKDIEKKLSQSKQRTLNWKNKYKTLMKLPKTEIFDNLAKNLSTTAKLFCKMQITQSGKGTTGRRFTLDEKILALSLFNPSPKAYRVLSSLFILPTRRTLGITLAKINIKSGIDDRIFDNLRQKVTKLPAKDKYCVLLFDKMALANDESMMNFIDGEICTHALVFMVRGVIKKYKQLLSYQFCTQNNPEQLKTNIINHIQKLQDVGLTIIATVCDQAISNMAVLNRLQKETEDHYMSCRQDYSGGYFEVNNNRIYPLYDPPNLLKGIRNNLITKNLRFEVNGLVQTAKWQHLIDLYNRRPGYNGVLLVPKLSAQLVLPDKIPKLNVRHCAQLFSQSVGVTLGYMAETGVLDRTSSDTANLLLFFDELFDSVNGNSCDCRNGKIYRIAVTTKSRHFTLWDRSLSVLRTMKFTHLDNEGLVPALAGWIKTIENITTITKILLSTDVNFILLKNFNLDPLENFFADIRGQCKTVTASAFEAIFKSLLVNNLRSPHPFASNCEKDDCVCLEFINSGLLKSDVASDEA